MTDERKSGILLLIGSLGGMVTMAIHPTMARTRQDTTAALGHSGIAHSLALVSVLLLVLGAFGLTKHLWGPDRLALAALVTFCAGSIAVMIAASVSGWVVPDMWSMMLRDSPTGEPMWRIAIAGIFRLNQAMSRIYSVAGAAAIVLWSVCCLRTARLSRPIAWFGVISGPLIAVLIFVGHLRLDVHGMAVVMLSEVIWFVGMGVKLLKQPA